MTDDDLDEPDCRDGTARDGTARDAAIARAIREAVEAVAAEERGEEKGGGKVMTEKAPPTVRCSHCKGTGCVEFTGVYAETLTLLRRHGREVSGAELARLDGCKATTMNNRLSALERLGLATSRRYGLKRLYRVIKE